MKFYGYSTLTAALNVQNVVVWITNRHMGYRTAVCR